jgi:2-polyprenyl-3-methyl-5-hydroxy-6-metoxy-1,4-benzoquinol methylase
MADLYSMLPNHPALLPSLRDEYFADYCRNKKVLHIGACDAPFTREKLADGLLLHSRLSHSAAEVVGLDVDTDAIDYLRENGIGNIMHLDMNDINKIDFEPDVIIFGETIEHLENIRTGLSNIIAAMNENTHLLISTPNALSLLNVFNAFFRKEHCHPDHVVNFTPTTLVQCLARNNLVVEEINFTFLNRKRLSVFKQIWRKLALIFPWYSETLIVSCRLQ